MTASTGVGGVAHLSASGVSYFSGVAVSMDNNSPGAVAIVTYIQTLSNTNLCVPVLLVNRCIIGTTGNINASIVVCTISVKDPRLAVLANAYVAQFEVAVFDHNDMCTAASVNQRVMGCFHVVAAALNNQLSAIFVCHHQAVSGNTSLEADTGCGNRAAAHAVSQSQAAAIICCKHSIQASAIHSCAVYSQSLAIEVNGNCLACNNNHRCHRTVDYAFAVPNQLMVLQDDDDIAVLCCFHSCLDALELLVADLSNEVLFYCEVSAIFVCNLIVCIIHSYSEACGSSQSCILIGQNILGILAFAESANSVIALEVEGYIITGLLIHIDYINITVLQSNLLGTIVRNIDAILGTGNSNIFKNCGSTVIPEHAIVTTLNSNILHHDRDRRLVGIQETEVVVLNRTVFYSDATNIVSLNSITRAIYEVHILDGNSFLGDANRTGVVPAVTVNGDILADSYVFDYVSQQNYGVACLSSVHSFLYSLIQNAVHRSNRNQLGNFVMLTAQFFTANSTVGHHVVAAFCVNSRSNVVLLNFCTCGVAQCCSFICNVAIAAIASIGGVATLGASRCSDYCIVAVASCCDFAHNIAVAALALVGDNTLLSAGGVSNYCSVAVSMDNNSPGAVAIVTYIQTLSNTNLCVPVLLVNRCIIGTTGNINASIVVCTISVKDPRLAVLANAYVAQFEVAVFDHNDMCTAASVNQRVMGCFHVVAAALNNQLSAIFVCHHQAVSGNTSLEADTGCGNRAAAHAVSQSQAAAIICCKHSIQASAIHSCAVYSQSLAIEVNGNCLACNNNHRCHRTVDYAFAVPNQLMVLQDDDDIAVLCCIHSCLDGFVLGIADLGNVIDCNQDILAIDVCSSVALNAGSCLQVSHCGDGSIDLVQNDGQILVGECFIDNQSILRVIEDQLQSLAALFTVLDAIDVTVVEGDSTGCIVLEANACTLSASSGHISEGDGAGGISQPDTVLGIDNLNVFSSEAVDTTSAVYQVVQVGAGGVLHNDVVNAVQNHAVVNVAAIDTGEGTAINRDVTSKVALHICRNTVAVHHEVDILDSQRLTLCASIAGAVDGHGAEVLVVCTIDGELHVLDLLDGDIFVDVGQEDDGLTVLDFINCILQLQIQLIANLSNCNQLSNFNMLTAQFCTAVLAVDDHVIAARCVESCFDMFFTNSIASNVNINTPGAVAIVTQTQACSQLDFAPSIFAVCGATDEVTVEGTTGNGDHMSAIAIGIEHPASSGLSEVTALNEHIAVHGEEHCTAVECGQGVVTALDGHLTNVAEHVVNDAFAVCNHGTSANAVGHNQFCISCSLEYNADNSFSTNCVCNDFLTVQVDGNLLTNNIDQRSHIASDFVALQDDDDIAVLCCIHSCLDGAVLNVANLSNCNQCRNFSGSNQNLATYGALHAFGPTHMIIGRSDGGNGFLGVTQSINSFLCNGNLATHSTVLAFGQTGFGTGGSLCGIDDLHMAQCIGIVLNVAMAALTGVGDITLIGASGVSNYCIVAMRYNSPSTVIVVVQTQACSQLDFAVGIFIVRCATDKVTVEGATINGDHITRSITQGVEHPATSQLREGTTQNRHIAVFRVEHCTAVDCGQGVVTAFDHEAACIAVVGEHVVQNAFTVCNHITVLNSQVCTVLSTEYITDESAIVLDVCGQGLAVQVDRDRLSIHQNQRIAVAGDDMALQDDDNITVLCCVHSSLDGFVLGIADLGNVINCTQEVLAALVDNAIASNAGNSIQAFDCGYGSIDLVQNDGQLVSTKLFVDEQIILGVVEDQLQGLAALFTVLDAIDVAVIEDHFAVCTKVLEANACALDTGSGDIGEGNSTIHVRQPDAVLGVDDFDAFCGEAVNAIVTIYQIVQVGTGGVLHNSVVRITQSNAVIVISAIGTGEGTAVNGNVTCIAIILVCIDAVAIHHEVDVLDGQRLTLCASIAGAVDGHGAEVLEVLTIDGELHVLDLLDGDIFVDIGQEDDGLTVLDFVDCILQLSIENASSSVLGDSFQNSQLAIDNGHVVIGIVTQSNNDLVDASGLAVSITRQLILQALAFDHAFNLNSEAGNSVTSNHAQVVNSDGSCLLCDGQSAEYNSDVVVCILSGGLDDVLANVFTGFTRELDLQCIVELQTVDHSGEDGILGTVDLIGIVHSNSDICLNDGQSAEYNSDVVVCILSGGLDDVLANVFTGFTRELDLQCIVELQTVDHSGEDGILGTVDLIGIVHSNSDVCLGDGKGACIDGNVVVGIICISKNVVLTDILACTTGELDVQSVVELQTLNNCREFGISIAVDLGSIVHIDFDLCLGDGKGACIDGNVVVCIICISKNVVLTDILACATGELDIQSVVEL